MKKVTNKQIREQLKALGFKPNGHPNYFVGRGFYARIVSLTLPQLVAVNPMSFEHVAKLTLQLAVKKSFDRWANSVDFQIDFEHVPVDRLNLKEAFQHARRIVKAKVFNFNSYFHHIDLDGC